MKMKTRHCVIQKIEQKYATPTRMSISEIYSYRHEKLYKKPKLEVERRKRQSVSRKVESTQEVVV